MFSTQVELVAYLKDLNSTKGTSGEYEAYCVKRMSGFPPLKLLVKGLHNLPGDPATNAGSIFTGMPDYTLKDGPQIPIISNSAWTQDSFRFCLYADAGWVPGRHPRDIWDTTFLSLNGEPELATNDPHSITSLINSTCFVSDTDLRKYNQIEHYAQINGNVTQCRIDFCARRHTDFETENGDSRIGSVKEAPLMLREVRRLANDETDAVFTAEGFPTKNFTISFRQNNLNHTLTPTSLGSFFRMAMFVNKWNQLSFMESPTWETLFERLASVFSDLIQGPLNPATSNVTLDAYGPVTFVEVRWFWMVLPFSLVLLSIVFLCLTIFESRAEAYLFKTSILAVLSSGGDVWHDTFAENVEKRSGKATYWQLEDVAKESRATYDRDDEGQLRLMKEQ